MLYALQYLKENSNDLTIPSEKALWEGKNSVLNRTMSTLEEPGKQRGKTRQKNPPGNTPGQLF